MLSLKDLGISQSEALVYLKLLDKPEGATLEEVLSCCEIPSHEIEAALGKLVERGFITVVSNRFEALDPKDVLTKILKEKERNFKEKLEDLREKVLVLQKSLAPLYWEKRLGIRPEEILMPLDNLPAMELQTVRIIANAEEFIYIFAESFGWYDKIREELFRALDRGVRVRVLMMVIDEASAKKARELKELGVEVKHCAEKWYPVRGTLRDNKELVFLIWATEKKGVPIPIHYRPHYTTNVGLIRIFKDAFEKRWEVANPITRR